MFKKESLIFLGASSTKKVEVDVYYNVEQLELMIKEVYVGVRFGKEDYRYFDVQDEYKCVSDTDKRKLHKNLINRFEDMKENVYTSLENLINEFNSVKETVEVEPVPTVVEEEKEWSDFKDDFARLEEQEETSAFERALEEELKREEMFDIISEILEDKPVRKAKKSVKKTTKKATKKSTAKKDEVVA